MTVYERSQNTGSPAGTDELRAEIARARAELGETMQELAGRMDVRSRARGSASRAGRQLRDAWLTPTPWVMVSASLASAALVVVLLRGRRR